MVGVTCDINELPRMCTRIHMREYIRHDLCFRSLHIQCL